MTQRGFQFAAFVANAAAGKAALQIRQEDHGFAALACVGKELANRVERRGPADERQVLPVDGGVQLVAELRDAFVPLLLGADGDGPPEPKTLAQRFHVVRLHHSRFVGFRPNQELLQRRSRLGRQTFVPGLSRLQADRAARGIEQHQRHGCIAKEQLVHQLVFVLAAQVPKKHLAVLAFGRRAAGMELFGGQRPNLHAVRGGLAFHVAVLREAPGQTGFAGIAVCRRARLWPRFAGSWRR